MALGIYKPGQGYWVRVLTAVAAGSIVLATAMWVWGQANTINLPKANWTLAFENAAGGFDADLKPGDTVEFQDIDPADPAQRRTLGTGRVKDITPGAAGSGTLVVDALAMERANPDDPESRLEFSVADARYVVDASDASSGLGSSLGGEDDGGGTGLGGATGRAQVVSAIGNDVVPLLYVQAGGASVVILVGALLIFYFVGSSKKAAEFLIATDGEMKKVNWSTRREVVGSTGVVIFAAFLIAALLYGVDLAFNQFFSLFGLHG